MPLTRRVLIGIAFAAIVVTRIEPQLLAFPFRDLAPVARAMTGRADRNWPQYPRFLAGVRAHTKPGDTIAIIAPSMAWDRGYSYAYYRASYFLSGRIVLPLSDADDRLHLENIPASTYIAAWRSSITPHGAVVWEGEGGALMRPLMRPR